MLKCLHTLCREIKQEVQVAQVLSCVDSAGSPMTLGETLLQVKQRWRMCLQQGERAFSRMGR